jgi:hypothetical protein
MKVQAVSGFVDREGGSFFQEWSALFVMEGAQGERILLSLSAAAAAGGAAESGNLLAGKQNGTLERMLLAGDFRALPVTDPLDGERVVCYRSFLAGGECAGLTSAASWRVSGLASWLDPTSWMLLFPIALRGGALPRWRHFLRSA